MGILSDMSLEELQDLVHARHFSKFSGPGDYWVPSGAQHNFIKLIGGASSSVPYEVDKTTWVEGSAGRDSFINVFVGGNGTGKTHMMVIKNGVMLGCIDNPYFKDSEGNLYPFYRYPTNSRKIWMVSNAAAIRDTIAPFMELFYPESRCHKSKEGRDYYCLFKGLNRDGSFNGRQLELKTYEQDVSEFRAATLWCADLDEPENKREIFMEISARFRSTSSQKGKICFTMTPLGEAAWVHDLVIGNTEWKVGQVYADIESNCQTHGIRGALTHDSIETMIAGWPEDERDARAHARWMHLRGVVYPTFNRKVHVVSPLEIPERGTIYCVCDPHTKKPPAIGWFKACDNGRLYMIAEYPEVRYRGQKSDGSGSLPLYYDDMGNDGGTYADYVEAIHETERRIGVASVRIIDPRFGNTPTKTGSKTILGEYLERGIYFVPAEQDLRMERGHTKVRSLLRHNLDTSKGSIVYPKFFISERCQNAIRAMERYAYKPTNDGNEMVLQDYKDFADVIRMMADWDWRYNDPMVRKEWHKAFNTERYVGTPAQGML